LGPWIASIWLFFLLQPLIEGWHHRDTAAGLTGIVLTVVFGAVYMAVWLTLRTGRMVLNIRPTLSRALAWIGALGVLSTLMILTLGEAGTASVVYVAVAAVMLLPFRWAACLAVAIAVLMTVLGATVPGWSSGIGLSFSVLAASLAVFGISSLMRRNIELIVAHEENASLAVENERTRFARDLHDILGHSLTVITVKAELAGRLLDVDPARARAEIEDLERLSRDALTDVRRAVEGYRDLTLPGELARARVALRAADIAADLPNSTDEVPTSLRELFAWTVREGVTNVIRHSGATRCTVRLGADGVEISDDGIGPCEHAERGHGLDGLRERAASAGAVLVTRPLDPSGFALTVQPR
ncbi:MAG: histidine kinase, partial [Nocardioidaceae bacterium]